jgi:glc operon protein GlcG
MSSSSASEWTVNRPNVSLAAARRVVQAAHAEAQRNGWHISVAVVDAGGEPVLLERTDAAIGISPQVAIGKARTAALLQAPSKMFEDFINDGRPSFLSTPGTTPLEGGVPLIVAGQVIGAVGVSGAHGPNDSQVAQFAADALPSA